MRPISDVEVVRSGSDWLNTDMRFWRTKSNSLISSSHIEIITSHCVNQPAGTASPAGCLFQDYHSIAHLPFRIIKGSELDIHVPGLDTAGDPDWLGNPLPQRPRGRPKSQVDTTARDLVAQAAAMTPMPHWREWRTAHIQLWDHGAGTKGKPRYNMKLRSYGPQAKLTAEKFCGLSKPSQFLHNLSRKLDMEPWERQAAKRIAKWLPDMNSTSEMLGFIGCTFRGNGTIRHPGQIAMGAFLDTDNPYVAIFCLDEESAERDGGTEGLPPYLNVKLQERQSRAPKAANYFAVYKSEDHLNQVCAHRARRRMRGELPPLGTPA